MHKSFLIVSFICFVSTEKQYFAFDPDVKALAECIEHHLVNIEDQYKSVQIVNYTAFLAAKRFYGKSMSNKIFMKRFKDFFYDLRSNRILKEISKNRLSERLRVALKQSLIICEDLLSSQDITISEQENSKAATQNNELITFGSNKDLFSACIENYLILTGHREFYLKDGFLQTIADFAARRYYGKTLSRESFYEKNRKFFHNLRNHYILHEMKITSLTTEVELSVQQAVENCTVDNFSLLAVPTFELEPAVTAHLLNLILVNWPEDIRRMIQSQDGRKLLRRYANDALTTLLYELNVCQKNSQMFRRRLRLFWKNRAREMYDANSIVLPYILHGYTLNRPTPHMVQSSFDTFINRKNTNFNDRNPVVPVSYLSKILNIHVSDGSYKDVKIDIYDNYIINGMTSAEYYFENQINQFYRIIFFFLELRARGISTDKDDVFDGPLPDDLVPRQIQAIIYDDDVYRDYLLDERSFYKLLIDGSTQNKIVQDLFKNARVLEENLILLRSNIPSTSDIQGSIRTETTFNSTVATMRSLKRKGDVWKNENGKCFPKRSKNLSSNNMNENLGGEILDQVINSPFDEKHNFFCYLFNVSSELGALQEQDEIKTENLYGYVTQSLKRKNIVRKNENGKCFSGKRSKTSKYGNNNNSDMKNLNLLREFEVTNSSLQESNLFTMGSELSAPQEQDIIETNSLYGYMTLSDEDFNELQFTYEELYLLQNLPY